MNRYKANTVEDIVTFDFISKSLYSSSHANPKRRIEGPLKEALDDVIREVDRFNNTFILFIQSSNMKILPLF